MEWSTGSRARPRALLIGGMIAGLAMASLSLVRPQSTILTVLPDETAAVVNGVAVERAELQRAIDALAADSRQPIGDEDAQYALTRLIEQELLVQRALELGFDQRDRTVRNTLVTAMVQMILAESESVTYSDEEVRSFYGENSDYFSRTGRVFVREIRVPVNESTSEEVAKEQAETASARLRLGESIEIVAREIGTPPIAPIPAGFLPPGQLRHYLGPTPAQAALTLQPGQVSEPIRGGSAYHVVVMVDREPGETPALEEVDTLVRNEMRRRGGDAAIRAYLDRLTDQADIRRADR